MTTGTSKEGLADRLRAKACNCRDNAKAELAVRDVFIEEYRAGISLPGSEPTPEKHARSMSLYDFTIKGEHRSKNFTEDADLYEQAAALLDERDADKARIEVLEKALTQLRNEVGGLEAFEGGVRSVIGNTNWSVIALRLKEADEALSQALNDTETAS